MTAQPQLSNSLDDIEKFNEPELVIGDIVRFTPYYASDDGGVGIVKKITTCEFKNPNYKPQSDTDPDYDASLECNQLFISLPCAIVVSALPDEQWLDYVVISCIEILSFNQLIGEIADAFPEYDAIDMFLLRRDIACKLSQYRNTEWTGSRYMPAMPYATSVIPFQGGVA